MPETSIQPGAKQVTPMNAPQQQDPPPLVASGPPRQAFGGPARPEHYRDGRLTREGMEHVIRNGHSVSISPVIGKTIDGYDIHAQAQIISRIEDLPSAIELAGDNQEELERLQTDLDKRKKALADDQAKLDTKNDAATAPVAKKK